MLCCRSHRTGWGWGGLTGFSPAGRPEFPPSCGSGPVAVGSGLWGRSQLGKFALTLRPTRRAPPGVGGLNGLAPTAADPEAKPLERTCDARDSRTCASPNSPMGLRDTLLAEAEGWGPSLIAPCTVRTSQPQSPQALPHERAAADRPPAGAQWAPISSTIGTVWGAQPPFPKHLHSGSNSTHSAKFALTLCPPRRAPAGVGGLNGLAPTAADPAGKPFERTCDARDGRIWAPQNSQMTPRDALLVEPGAWSPSLIAPCPGRASQPPSPKRSRTSGLQRIAPPGERPGDQIW